MTFPVLLLTLALASAPQLPSGVTCVAVRAYVALVGRDRAIEQARAHGFSEADIREAEKCLRR